jgi:hypothetical protein
MALAGEGGKIVGNQLLVNEELGMQSLTSLISSGDNTKLKQSL